MTSENMDNMIEKMKVKDEDDTRQANVKRAIQLILKTAKTGIVPLCQEISKIVMHNHELECKAEEFEVHFKAPIIFLFYNRFLLMVGVVRGSGREVEKLKANRQNG